MLYFYPRKLFEHFRIGYFLPLNFSGVCKTNQKSCFKERETKRLQRLSHVMQKFSKKLKTVARTRLHFCAVLIALQALVITTFFGHILYKGRPSLCHFLLGKQIVLPSSFAGGGNGHTEKLTKNLTLPVNSLLQQRRKEIRHHHLTTIFILLSFTQ